MHNAGTTGDKHNKGGQQNQQNQQDQQNQHKHNSQQGQHGQQGKRGQQGKQGKRGQQGQQGEGQRTQSSSKTNAQEEAYAGYQPSLLARSVAELLGAFILTLIGNGAAAEVVFLADYKASSVPDLLVIALAEGWAYFVVVLVFGKISGAHANPVVTVSLLSIRRFPWKEAPAYLVAQFIGGILGSLTLLIVYGHNSARIQYLGGPTVSAGTSLLQGLLIEALGAGIFIMAISASAVDSRAPAGWSGFAMGISLIVIIMFIGPATGGMINPARSGASVLIASWVGISVSWGTYLFVYFLGPLAGGVIAAIIYIFTTRGTVPGFPRGDFGPRREH